MSATTPHEALLEDVRSWLQMADNDLRLVRICLRLEPTLVPAAAFHCQQAAEKLIKALLMLAAVPFPKTHDLRRLADLLPEGQTEEVSVHAGDLAGVSRWVIAGRYPAGFISAALPDGMTVAAEADRLDGLRQLVAERIEALAAAGAPS